MCIILIYTLTRSTCRFRLVRFCIISTESCLWWSGRCSNIHFKIWQRCHQVIKLLGCCWCCTGLPVVKVSCLLELTTQGNGRNNLSCGHLAFGALGSISFSITSISWQKKIKFSICCTNCNKAKFFKFSQAKELKPWMMDSSKSKPRNTL